MSWSERIATWKSSSTESSLSGRLELPAQVGHSLFEVEGGCDVFQPQAQLYHRESHIRLDPHDHRFRSAQPDGVRDVLKDVRSERVHHVHGGDVHDDAPGPAANRLLQKR